MRVRVWANRFATVLIFVIFAVALGSITVRDAEVAAIRPEYARTTFAIRGEVPALDDQALLRTLPDLERAIAATTRAIAEPLDEFDFDAQVNAGLPSLLWRTDAIEVARPADAGDHRVWEIEALLGSDTSIIITFDGQSGPRYLYDIDPAVLAALRGASGLPATGPD